MMGIDRIFVQGGEPMSRVLLTRVHCTLKFCRMRNWEFNLGGTTILGTALLCSSLQCGPQNLNVEGKDIMVPRRKPRLLY